jgi:hypothetical protein
MKSVDQKVLRSNQADKHTYIFLCLTHYLWNMNLGLQFVFGLGDKYLGSHKERFTHC